MFTIRILNSEKRASFLLLVVALLTICQTDPMNNFLGRMKSEFNVFSELYNHNEKKKVQRLKPATSQYKQLYKHRLGNKI